MTDYLIAPPDERIIPVSRGADRAFTVQRTDETTGDPVDFGAGTTVYMWVDVDAADPTKVDAVIDGSDAAFVVPSTVLDLVRNRTKWRVIWDQGDLETPILVGRFERHDG